MASILLVGTAGSNDPTTASFPFVMALSALERDHQPQIALLGEAAYLMKDSVIDEIHGVGFRPLRELVDEAISNKIPIHL